MEGGSIKPMNRCLWCQEEITTDYSWSTVLVGLGKKHLCSICQEQLQLLKGSTCEKCNRISNLSPCRDCRWWDRYFKGKDPLSKNVSTFRYNAFMQEVVAKWKYRGDYELLHIFVEHARQSFFRSYHSIIHKAVLCPIPLSQDRLKERRFNQAKALAEVLALYPKQVVQHMSRLHHEIQAKKDRRQRIFSRNPFKLEKKPNKIVILVDDIYTTGTTLRHAASLLREHGCRQVFAYTLIRG